MKQLAISLLFILCVVGCKAKSSAGSDQQNPEKAPPPVMAAKITPPMTPAGTDPATKLAAMATTNPKAAPATNPAGSTVRYYFFDGCWDGRGKSVEEAREKCKKLGKTGRVWQRKGCLCNDPHLITVKSADPVAFYFMSTHLHHLGKTPAIVRKKCQKGREESIKKGITADYDCAKEKIRKAHGPYTRVFAFSDFDDPKQFVYLDTEEGVWMDETGEAPCFVGGTPVQTPRGEVPIEDLVPGDRVYAWDQRREKMVTAVVERLIRRPSTMVSTLELCSGARIVTTGNHPFFSSVETGFIHAGTLTPRDQVMVMRHRRLVSERICAITVGGHRPVYTLSVSSPHTYFACGVLVHNY